MGDIPTGELPDGRARSFPTATIPYEIEIRGR